MILKMDTDVRISGFRPVELSPEDGISPAMNGVQLAFADRRLVRIGAGAFPVLVLLDGDVEMWIAEVAFPSPPTTGDTFHFRCSPWVLTHLVDGGCRAEPLPM